MQLHEAEDRPLPHLEGDLALAFQFPHQLAEQRHYLEDALLLVLLLLDASAELGSVQLVFAAQVLPYPQE